MPQNDLTTTRALLEGVLKGMANDPSQVRIEYAETSSQVTYDVLPTKAEAGRVMGKNGVHADALRLLFGAIYSKLGKRLHLLVVDPRR